MKILLAYDIPREIVGLIQRMYADTVARVITEDGLSEAFLILAGVMQKNFKVRKAKAWGACL